jgi:hypothetical protein
MSEQIIDGTGNGYRVKVDKNNDLHTFSITESEAAAASKNGRGYNLNTGTIALTGTGESAVLYFKNDENTDFVITALAVGLGTRSATITDAAVITLYKGNTGGTIISDANLVEMNSNTNFGSSNTLASTSLAYAASATGKTITGGTKHVLLYMTGTRLFAGLDIEMPKGSNLGITIDLNTSGGANVYVALIGYVKDPNV